MKKIAIMLLAALFSAVSFAQLSRQAPRSDMPIKPTSTLIDGVTRTTKAVTQSGPRRASTLVTPPSGLLPDIYYTIGGAFFINTTNGWQNATNAMPFIEVIIDGNDIYAAGLAYYAPDAWIKGTISGTTASFPSGQQVDDDPTYPEWLVGTEDESTVTESIIFDFDQEKGILNAVTPLIIEGASTTQISPYAYWQMPKFSKTPPTPVEVPNGIDTKEYSITYEDYQGSAGSGTINIAIDGTDIYFQGFCGYIPEAWVKGTLEENVVTIPTDQYLGNYSGITDIKFLPTAFGGEDLHFTYNAEADTYTADKPFFSVYGYSGEYYYDAYYANAVLKKVIERPATPANPRIMSVENTSFGYMIEFNVPTVDTEGNGMVASKLSYQFFTEEKGVVSELVFTPATHQRLLEDMSVFPYRFTDGYDFYPTFIYLNDLFSFSWNKIGIKSIYTGGGETNETEIQWFTLETLITLPDGVEPEEFTLELDGKAVYGAYKYKGTRLVAFDGDDIYVQGLASFFDTAYSKGTLNADGQYVFTSGQFVGEDQYGKEFLIGLRQENGKLVYAPQFVFDFDPTTRVLSLANGNYYAESGAKADDSIVWMSFEKATYTPGAYVKPEIVEAPEDLVTEKYQLTAYDTYYHGDISHDVEVGFYGDNEVYFHGLSEYADGWVKGVIDANGVVSIPETSLGLEKALGEDELFFPATQFIYDATEDKFLCEDGFSIYDEKDFYYDELKNVVLTKVHDAEATPADPSVINFELYMNVYEGDTELRFSNYPYVVFDIPTVDVNGDPMVLDNLSYVIYIVDAQGEQQPLTLKSDLYYSLNEDMTEIPYTYSDYLDFYYMNGSWVYLNQGPETIASWKKIGVQSIYRGLGVENRSNIGWFDIEAYTERLKDIASGISNVEANGGDARYFDAQGRRASDTAKGLLIKQTRMPDGTTRTKKVIRK